jgi:GMP synthase (glutamine-hydrolysing)
MSIPPVLILRHVCGQPAGSTVDVLTTAGLQITIWDVAKQPLPVFQPQAWSGIVVLGGPMNVDQTAQHPNLADEVQWLKAALKEKLPVLGLCLGGQLLAKALGAKVTANPIPEVGWMQIELTAAGEQDPLLSDLESPVDVCQWHGDTFELPAGSVLLATSRDCRHQAFRFGTSAWGIQFHPEVTAELLASWIAEHNDPADRCCPSAAHIDTIQTQSVNYLPKVQILGRRIIGRFGKLCRETAETRAKRVSS